MGINMNEVPSTQYLTEGTHPELKIAEVNQVENRNTGNKGFEFILKDPHGATVKATIWTTKNNGAEKNYIGMKIFLERSGIWNELNSSERSDFSPMMLKGRRFGGVVTMEEGRDGKKYSRIDMQDDVFPVGSRAASAPAPHPTAPARQEAPATYRQPAPGDGYPGDSETEGAADDLPF